MHAVDRVADVLPGGDDQTESGQQHDGQAVVEPEHGRVDVHVADFYQALQAPEHVKHGVPGRRDTRSVSPASHQSAGLSAAAQCRQHGSRRRRRGRHHLVRGHEFGAALRVLEIVVVLVVLRRPLVVVPWILVYRRSRRRRRPATHRRT